MKNKSFNMKNEYPLKDGLYPVKFNSMKQKFQAHLVKTSIAD